MKILAVLQLIGVFRWASCGLFHPHPEERQRPLRARHDPFSQQSVVIASVLEILIYCSWRSFNNDLANRMHKALATLVKKEPATWDTAEKLSPVGC
ncbi:hypothetical protein M747DRAFT_1494 [Aspergillus niger ATCC 13496]|uniref:Uncharacterized protein n=1 Tax=Aspergillus niger ATCC 13496 TaxID=1353008 RepID=A0A370CD05_ASPNG|nr:hypothetical protein M747DRAFT_1494 [Aspergillus niger ATCC 13496]